MDDYIFPSYSSSKARSRQTQFGESMYCDILAGACANMTHSAGDAFVRELDVSKITLRLKEKQDKKGDNDHDDDHTIAKLQGSTSDVLQRCLVRSQCSDIRISLTMTFTVQTN